MSLLANTIRGFLKDHGFTFSHGCGESMMFKDVKKQVNIHDNRVSLFYCYEPDKAVHIGDYGYQELFADLDRKGAIYYFLTT